MKRAPSAPATGCRCSGGSRNGNPPQPLRASRANLALLIVRQQAKVVQAWILATGLLASLCPVGCERNREVAMRASTWNLVEGFDRVRWGDDMQTVRALYPRAGERKKRFGRNPLTGEEIMVNAGLYMQSGDFAVPVPPEGINLLLSMGFDDSGMSDIGLLSEGGDERYEGMSAEEWGQVISTYAKRTAEELDLSPFDPEQAEQSWNIEGIRVELLLEWDNFSFSLERSRR